jgi:hypothetical protein
MAFLYQTKAFDLQLEFNNLVVPTGMYNPHGDTMLKAFEKLQSLADTLDNFTTWNLTPNPQKYKALQTEATAAEAAKQEALRYCPQSSWGIITKLLDMSEEVLLRLEALLPLDTLTLFDQRLVTMKSEWAVVYSYIYRTGPFGDSMKNTFVALEKLARYLDRFPGCDLEENEGEFEKLLEMAGELETQKRRLKNFLTVEECKVPRRMIKLGDVMWIRAALLLPSDRMKLWNLGFPPAIVN